MATTTPTILDQISAEKTKVSERLARLDTDRAAVATQVTDLETAERVLMRVGKTPPAGRPTSAAAAEAKAPTATRRAAGGRQTQPRESQPDANPAHRASASASWLWAEPVSHGLDFLEIPLASGKELVLPSRQPGERSARTCVPTAHAWIAPGGRSTRARSC